MTRLTSLTPGLEDFIDTLPKVELHVHLVGSASPTTVLELARRHPDSQVPKTEEELTRFYRFRDFPDFARVYSAVNELIRTPADIATLVIGVARELAAQNARYVELTVTPYAHVLSGMGLAEITEALDVAARAAEHDHGLQVAYIFDIWGDRGEESARVTLEAALEHPPERLVGFGLAGIEQARPPYRAAFADAFAAARAAGLHSVPHAGEMSGPQSIWTVLEDLAPERIGHGIDCLEDPRLVAHLRETQLPLEVCPTSNVCTGQVPDISAHPFRRLLDEGLYVTLNSDDPPMFGTTLTGEYRTVAQEFALTAGELADLARNAVRASFLPQAGKDQLLAEIDGACEAASDRLPNLAGR